jgi:hypothetical protein
MEQEAKHTSTESCHVSKHGLQQANIYARTYQYASTYSVVFTRIAASAGGI